MSRQLKVRIFSCADSGRDRVLAGIALAARTANTPDTIIAHENAFWKAYGDGNVEDLSKLLLPDFANVEAQMWSRDQVLIFIRQFHQRCTLAPVKLVAPRVTFLTPEIATLVYRATESPTFGSRTLSGETNISTVWLRRDGRWQMHLHTGTRFHRNRHVGQVQRLLDIEHTGSDVPILGSSEAETAL